MVKKRIPLLARLAIAVGLTGIVVSLFGQYQVLLLNLQGGTDACVDYSQIPGGDELIVGATIGSWPIAWECTWEEAPGGATYVTTLYGDYWVTTWAVYGGLVLMIGGAVLGAIAIAMRFRTRSKFVSTVGPAGHVLPPR